MPILLQMLDTWISRYIDICAAMRGTVAVSHGYRQFSGRHLRSPPRSSPPIATHYTLKSIPDSTSQSPRCCGFSPARACRQRSTSRYLFAYAAAKLPVPYCCWPPRRHTTPDRRDDYYVSIFTFAICRDTFIFMEVILDIHSQKHTSISSSASLLFHHLLIYFRASRRFASSFSLLLATDALGAFLRAFLLGIFRCCAKRFAAGIRYAFAALQGL